MKRLTYRQRLTSLVLLDSVMIGGALFAATWIVYPSALMDTEVILISAVGLIIFHQLFCGIYKLYKKVWTYASVGEMLVIVKAVTFSNIATGIVQFLINDFSIYIRALSVTWMLNIILIGGSRFIWRIVRQRYMANDAIKKRTLIVGAGVAGAMIARHLKNEQKSTELCPVAFVDDDFTKHHMQIYNLPVLGSVHDVPRIVKEMNIDHIVIAIPSLGNGELAEIVSKCSKTKAKVQMLPKIEDIISGRISVSTLKNVEVEDVLGRSPVELDIHAISSYVTGKTVMVTGAGGSIGSELCRQLIGFSPKKILLVGHGEFSIYSIDMELNEKFGKTDIQIVPIIGDVQDRNRMFEIVQQHKPVIIYHAAAHKHVPLMEYNPHEGFKNNVIGTKNVAEAADTYGVETFVLVSTDKAVNPTNVMGATKRVAEMVIQDLAQRSKTKISAVRFGNVLGSRGSVIPLFKKQIEKGGPVTVTHAEMTRYFMTIPEASRLVIQAGVLAKGGEIFVLDMGEPVKIIDLARNIIKLSGYTEEEISIQITGIRPGEKLYEELLIENEVLPNKVYEKVYVGRTLAVNKHRISALINSFNELNVNELKKELMGVVYEDRQLMVKGL